MRGKDVQDNTALNTTEICDGAIFLDGLVCPHLSENFGECGGFNNVAWETVRKHC